MAQDAAIPKERITEALRLACGWLVDHSQVTQGVPENTELKHPHSTWVGSFREYDHRRKRWLYFAPVWHTGQAVKALVMAHAALEEAGYLEAAKLGAEFIRSNVVSEGEDAGLILAHEGEPPDMLRLPGIPEGLDGIVELAKVQDSEALWRMTLGALDWLIRKAYRPELGVILNWYTHKTATFEPYTMTPRSWGKPTLDGGLFVKAYRYTGDSRYRDVAINLADTLLADEDPPGNWLCYGPARKETGAIHPRHAYWYGYPMVHVYDMTQERKYLEAAVRSGDWYMKAMRRDGGMFRGTYVDGSTDSFGHAASGVGSAVIMWIDLCNRLEDERYVPYIRKGLRFLLSMQVRKAEDPNMQGTIIEKIMPPDGTDASPYLVRDLGTIFFVQAAALLLETPAVLSQVV